jgi:hypothetical protein
MKIANGSFELGMTVIAVINQNLIHEEIKAELIWSVIVNWYINILLPLFTQHNVSPPASVSSAGI